MSDQFSISPGMPQIQQICGSFGEVFVQEIKKQSDGVLVKGTVNVQILYESAEEEVPCGCLKGELVFEELLETAEPVKIHAAAGLRRRWNSFPCRRKTSRKQKFAQLCASKG